MRMYMHPLLSQARRANKPAKLLLDNKTDSTFVEREHKFKQIVPPQRSVEAEEKSHYAATSCRAANRLCQCAPCDRKSIDVLFAEEQQAAEATRRQNKESKLAKMHRADEWANALVPMPFLMGLANVPSSCEFTCATNTDKPPVAQ